MMGINISHKNKIVGFLKKASNPMYVKNGIMYIRDQPRNYREGQRVLKMLKEMQNGQLQDATQYRNEKLLEILKHIRGYNSQPLKLK